MQITVPDYQSLMLPVLVTASKGEIRIGAAVEELADELNLTPDQRAELLPSGRQTVFSNRVHWAKTYLAQAGLIENTRRGHFKITTRGQQTLATHPSRIDNAFLSRFEEFQRFKERARASQSPPADGARAEAEMKVRALSTPRVASFYAGFLDADTPDEIMRRA